MNRKNLKPFDTWEPEAHRAISSKGGIASGLARRRKAALFELVGALLEAYQEQQATERETKRLEYNARKRSERNSRNRTP